MYYTFEKNVQTNISVQFEVLTNENFNEPQICTEVFTSLTQFVWVRTLDMYVCSLNKAASFAYGIYDKQWISFNAANSPANIGDMKNTIDSCKFV